ncbi:hypothetical protein [Methylocystis sp. S23]|jgi:hypothetical protein
MLGELIGAALLIHGLVGAEASSAMRQGLLILGALAIMARIRSKSRAGRA